MTGTVSDSAATAVLSALLEARTGQHTIGQRAQRIEPVLLPLMREYGADTLDQLVRRMLDGRDASLGDRVVEALLNQETSFFREPSVFDMMVDAVIERPGSKRIWCAGSSTGQEPYSLAMLFAERAEQNGTQIPEIVATEIGRNAAARAHAGRFSHFEIQRGLPMRRMIRWFDNVGDEWVAKPELRSMIRFSRHNLVADAPPPGQFDLILCRNVLLYFSAGAKAELFERLHNALQSGGYLILGAGETVLGQTDRFTPSRRFRGLYERAEAKVSRSA